ncbi:hypothetical protein [Photorhabdus khanii]|uniref:Uncharacterized protein n=1 Tax=Photorhabdus khanii subsp. guanajuatensis TaxID=2100166 RepID=A0A4R4IPW6_9GAMM|nr:hypothetical protein [Photorhabdus khanii]TDB42697.1 hypothetical protein C5467_23625 [Photorhabdus khanii subsp. guanajuatensis]
MNKIISYEVIERFPEYDKSKNKKRLNQQQLLPIGIKWQSNKDNYQISNLNGLRFQVLNDMTGLVVIESPMDENDSKAYILNADNTIRCHIKITSEKIIYLGVGYQGNDLKIYAMDRDCFQCTISENNCCIGEIFPWR